MPRRRKLPISETDYLVLKALKDCKEKTIKELKEATGLTSTGVELAVTRLKERGWVIDRREETFPFRRFVKITEEGLKQLQALELLEELVDISEILQKRRGPRKKKET